MCRAPWNVACLLALAGAAATSWAQPLDAPASPPPSRADRRPDAARRTVATFDFEEFAINPEPIPIAWRVGQDAPGRERPGFPLFNLPALDDAVAFAGEGSVRLPTRGGSTSLLLEAGVIPVFPDADYRVSTMVRTQGLRHARAFIEACLVDGKGRLIEASRRRSEPIHTDGSWAEAGVTLWGEWPDAAFVRLELLVLQPELFEPGTPGYQRVWPTDVSGAAWFDNVRVIQQPRITLATGHPGNVVPRPETPAINILARDLAGETLEASARVYDLSGRLVAQTSRTINQGRWQESWAPPLADLGWYRAVVEVHAGGERIGFGVLDFAWVPPPPLAPSGAGGLGAVLTDQTPLRSAEFARAVHAAGLEHLAIPVWTSDLSASGLDALASRLQGFLSRLSTVRGRVAFSLSRVPAELAGALGLREEQVVRAVAADPAVWGPFLDPLLDHFGQSVTRWHIGQIGDESAGATVAQDLSGLDAGLSRLVPGPVIVVPWRADRQRPDAPTAPVSIEYSVLVPTSIAPEGVQTLVSAWLEPPDAGTPPIPSESTTLGARPEPSRASFVIEGLDRDRFGARAAVIDMVKRAVFAWAGSTGADPRLSLVDPWLGGEHVRSPLAPRPELAAWRTLRDRLRGREVVGELPMSPGTRCLILRPRHGAAGDGALVAWNDWATPDNARLEAMLTLGPVRVIDPFGNEQVVEPDVQTRGELPARLHRIHLTDMPVFIEGVDVALVTLQSSLHIEPGLVPAVGTARDLELVLDNPWNTPLSGRAVIVEPGGSLDDGSRDRSWRIEPRTFVFEAPPGGQARMPLSLLLREFEPGGRKRWIVDLRLSGREDLGWITVTAPLEVGLEGIDLRVSCRRAGGAVEVEVTIANRRALPVDLDVTVFAPDFPRERRSIGQVAPRTQLTRRFSYASADALAGESITASVREIETGARLNASAVVP